MRLAAANAFDVEEIRLCANGRLPRVPRKPRDVRRNSYESKDKNDQCIRYLYRGGESGIRTMNLAGRIHLKNRMNSASCAPETLLRVDVMRRQIPPTGPASFGLKRAKPVPRLIIFLSILRPACRRKAGVIRCRFVARDDS